MRLKSLYDGVASTVDAFFTSRSQALLHLWKKCVDRKGDYIEKQT